MISVIICSQNSDISPELKTNIDKTAGVEYELVVFDNSRNNYSIFSAYNEGVKRARFPYLCFMHEDILYYTNGWGNKVVDHFQDSRVGIIGVVGSHFMPKTPSGWYLPQVVSGGCLQGISQNGKYRTEKRINLTYFNSHKSIEAVAVDGMWFCMPKRLFPAISFDEQTYKGFHCYDLDICLQVRQAGFQIRIVSDILLEHSSYGNFSTEWIKNTYLFYNKWKDKLPQVAGVTISPEEMKIREDMVAETFLWMGAYAQCNEELAEIRQSRAYRLGKFVMKPISAFRKFL